MKTFFVIDGFSYIFQAFYAIRGGMVAPDGTPTNAVYGFTQLLDKLKHSEHADYICVAFDTPGPTFRHEMYPDYKANRSETPEELVPQIPVIREMITRMEVPMYERGDVEADDIIATLAKRLANEDVELCVISSDKDLRQIFTVNPKVRFYSPRDGERSGPDQVMDKFGVRPEQIADYLGLAGDASDNIPGVHGIGPKRASELLAQYGDIDNLYKHVDELKKSKMKDNLIEQEANARLSKQLAILKYDVDFDFKLDDCKITEPDPAELIQRLNELGLNRLARTVLERTPAGAPGLGAGTLFDMNGPPPATENGGEEPTQAPAPDAAEYHAVTNEAELKDLCRQIKRAGRFAVDTETTHLDPMLAELVGISVSVKAGVAYYIPVRSPEGGVDVELIRKHLGPYLADPATPKVGQNIKYDLIVLLRHGFDLAGLDFDTMIADYLLDPSLRGHDMDSMAMRYLNHKTIPIHDLIGGTKNKPERTMDQVELPKITQYASEDADITLRLYQTLAPRLKKDGLDGLFAELEMPLVEVLAEMEMNGINLDVDYLRKFSTELHAQLDEVKKTIYKEAGCEFDLNSPKQLAKVLFEDMGIKPIKKGKTGPSTDAEVLTELAYQYDIAKYVLEHRELVKLTGTYVDTLPEMVHPVDKRLHTEFNQTVAATGRLSSTNPNLQNIPVRTQQGRQIRKAFIPADDNHTLLVADYSQIELRFIAHLSEDANLIRAFENDEDIHSAVAANVFGVPLKKVTDDQRRVAKTVNFGLIYGQTAHGLSQQLEIGHGEAAEFIRLYFEKYKGVEDFIETSKENARQRGYVTTIRGRRRPLPNINAKNRMVRENAERMAVNTIVQGSAADLIKAAMIRMRDRMRADKVKSRMLLQIHDELVFDVPKKEEKTMTAAVREVLTGAETLRVPLKVDIGSGPNWLDAK